MNYFNPYARSSKYGNKKTVLGKLVFDSKKESERFLELSMLEKAGVIKNLERQKSLRQFQKRKLKEQDFTVQILFIQKTVKL